MNDNKLIADFIGWDIESLSTIPSNLHPSNLELDNDEVLEYKFHTSWDWLMPVVEKIEEIAVDSETISYKVHKYRVDTSYSQCTITDTLTDEVVADNDGDKLFSTYRAVVEFIKLINTQIPS